MNAEYLNHLLTEEEAIQFNREGYLIVNNALDSSLLKKLLKAFDRCCEQVVRDYNVDAKDRFLLLDILGLDRDFFDLIDYPVILPKVWGILGWNIQSYHSHLCYAPQISSNENHYTQCYLHSNNTLLSNKRTALPLVSAWQWHRDSGQVNQDLGPLPHPRISVKVAYFLTDLKEPRYGNMYLIPGSHLDRVQREVKDPTNMEGATPICVPAGSALIFDRRIFHSSSPNFGTHSRKVIFYGYSHRWFRPRDDMTVSHWFEGASALRKQLLGASLGSYGYSSPTPKEVPLRAWIEENCPGSIKSPYGSSSPKSMEDVSTPWNNSMSCLRLNYLNQRLEAWSLDRGTSIILGQKNLPTPDTQDAVFFCGTDVSGSLHLGHLMNFLIGSALAAQWSKTLTVSLNEAESILTRGNSLSSVMKSRSVIQDVLTRHAIETHSRLEDEILNCLALVIFKQLNKLKYQDIITEYYGTTLNAPDLFSISVMTAVPLRLCMEKKARHAIGVYGIDELPHLLLIFDLYADKDFQDQLCAFDLGYFPLFGFAVTGILPGESGHKKMSKTIPDELIPFEHKGRQTSNPEIVRTLYSATDFINFNKLLPANHPLMHSAFEFLSNNKAF